MFNLTWFSRNASNHGSAEGIYVRNGGGDADGRDVRRSFTSSLGIEVTADKIAGSGGDAVSTRLGGVDTRAAMWGRTRNPGRCRLAPRGLKVW